MITRTASRSQATNSQAVSKTVPASRKLNAAVNPQGDRATLEQVAQVLNEQAQILATTVESRLDMPIDEISNESQSNTKMLLDWTADIYSIAADISEYLNPDEA